MQQWLFQDQSLFYQWCDMQIRMLFTGKSPHYFAPSYIGQYPCVDVFEPEAKYRFWQYRRMKHVAVNGAAVFCFPYQWHQDIDQLLSDIANQIRIGQTILVFELLSYLQSHYETERFEQVIDRLVKNRGLHAAAMQQPFLATDLPVWARGDIEDSVVSICLSRRLEQGSVRVDSLVDFSQ
ncbi:hypothetical protein OAT84_03355 [Gammaproteobacteria bacterium]|nr:hypothetical protein [Gammaproteobacteria bacterium]